MNEIKLVIWDLDNTLWEGNLGEGEVVLSESNKNIIKALANRGIMNSICSKNSYEAVKEVLAMHNIWDYFIFPMISHTPKGEIVKQIIKNSQLRPENILFIDDEQLNLEEVKYYNPGINVAKNDFIHEILEHESLAGKQDEELSRLKQYKIIEKKHVEKASYASNEAFLRNCNIEVQLIKDCSFYIDRIHEMIQRTNQLNYTKQRVDVEELRGIIENPNIQSVCVRVTDKFGDYGISGFYALENNCLKHFLFSCRILNLGIEQWIYSRLGCPAIDIVGEVAVGLRDDYLPDWINEKESSADNHNDDHAKDRKEEVKCLIRGGCDLEQLYHYLKNDGLAIETEFNYMSENGIPIHREHSEIIRGGYYLTDDKKSYLIENLPFYDKAMFHSDIFNSKYSVLIYSVLMDYSQGLYSLKYDSNVIVAYGDYNLPLTNPDCWNIVIRNSKGFIDETFLDWFGKNFDYVGPLTEKRFRENLEWMRSNINQSSILILLNGSEVELEHEWESGRWLRHKSMNTVLKDFCRENNNTILIDVNKFIKSIDDVTDNIRHYKREHYKKVADEISSIINYKA